LLAAAALREKKPKVARTQLGEPVAQFSRNSEFAKVKVLLPVQLLDIKNSEQIRGS
jgi:hypothetical protein